MADLALGASEGEMSVALLDALDASPGLALGIFLGLAFGLFMACMWMRVWRWFFGLLGLRA